MKTNSLIATGAVAMLFVASVQAQNQTKDNLLSLTAQSSVKATQDYLSVTLSASRDGATGQAVQAELKKVLDQAIILANPLEAGDLLQAKTGQFRVVPVYDSRDQRIQGWRGTAQLIIEGKDFVRITTLAGNIQKMPVTNVAFGLSPSARAKYEEEAQKLAVADFRQRAKLLTEQFGFSNYSIDNVHVNASHDMPMPMARMEMAASMPAKMASPIPVEAGETTVTVVVNGSVQMR